MYQFLLGLTGAVLAVGTTMSYRRTKDVLHPLMFLGPLFFYATVIDPWSVRDEWQRFFGGPENIGIVFWLDLFGMLALVIGATHGTLWNIRSPRQFRIPSEAINRNLLLQAALILAGISLAAYAYGIVKAGGFVAAFSQVKGGGEAVSGYFGEAKNLGLVATALTVISRYQRGWTSASCIIIVLGVVPNLLQGTFGGRRGPLFLSLTGLSLALLMIPRRRPKLIVMAALFSSVVLAVLFVWSQRQHMYLGSTDANVKWDAFVGAASQAAPSQGNNFVYGAAFTISTHQANQFTWGRELAVNLLVRPIPRQVWPDKYRDVGATWVTNGYPGLGHLTFDDWVNAVGWLPFAGSSAASIFDLFGEFGWGAILAMYFIGRGFAELYLRRRALQGMWNVLYLEALILSIYLATQSFSAFYHRYLILAVPTILIWRRIARPVKSKLVRAVYARPAVAVSAVRGLRTRRAWR